jgi:hypothetical protein
MNTDNELAYAILLAGVDFQLLAGLYSAIFNENKNKFFAFTYVKINRDEYENASYYLGRLDGYSSYADDEKIRKYITPNSWQSKSIDERIEEGIYTSYGIRFTGILHNEEWYINSNLTYFGEEFLEKDAKNILSFHDKIDKPWETFLFQPYEPFSLPDGKPNRDIEEEEFLEMPRLVAFIKQEKKKEVNHAFRKYINEEIFKPFFAKLKIKYPEEYNSFSYLGSEEFILIFPEHKKVVMMIVMVLNIDEDPRIEYFIYKKDSQKIYQWNFTKRKKTVSQFDFAEEVLDTLSALSNWNHPGFLNSSRTMDDEQFWNEHVFKQEGNKFIYLNEVSANFNSSF